MRSWVKALSEDRDRRRLETQAFGKVDRDLKAWNNTDDNHNQGPTPDSGVAEFAAHLQALRQLAREESGRFFVRSFPRSCRNRRFPTPPSPPRFAAEIGVCHRGASTISRSSNY